MSVIDNVLRVVIKSHQIIAKLLSILCSIETLNKIAEFYYMAVLGAYQIRHCGNASMTEMPNREPNSDCVLPLVYDSIVERNLTTYKLVKELLITSLEYLSVASGIGSVSNTV